jgi:SLBB domain
MRYFGKPRVSLIASRKSRVKGVVYPLLLTALSLFFPALVSAQDEGEPPDLGRSRAAQYYLGDQDELLIKVNIWGFVRRPGQYMVPKDTDLISLISFAGGPLDQAKMKKIKIIRSSVPAATSSGATMGANASDMMLASPVARGGAALNTPSTPAQQVIEVNVKKYLVTGQQSLIPELQPGDTIVISGGTLQFVGKALDFVSKFAVIAQIYFWVDVANNR